jgi:hypothetical protein
LNRRPAFPSDLDIDAALRELAVYVELPATPAIAGTVAARLRAAPAPSRRRRTEWVRRRRVLAFAVFLLVLLAGTLAAIPGTRTAIADLLGFDGVRIEVDASRTPPAARFDKLGLGQPVTLEEARKLSHFRLRTLESARLGTPEIYFAPFPAGGQVTFIYRASGSLRESAETGVGLLFTQFRADIHEDVVVHKNVDQGARVEVLDIGGSKGYWVQGPHAFYGYTDENDVDVFEEARAAGNALLWQEGGMTYRIEGAITKAEALALAASLR